jgi:hypothetical protein
LKWRRRIQKELKKAQTLQGVHYATGDKLEVIVRFYFAGRAAEIHDVDNRLKDLLDALQGRIGGSKKVKPRFRTIPNDNLVWRIFAEKALPPRQSHCMGHLTVRPLSSARH